MSAVVNLKHEPDAVANGAVLIDRRTRWGNPFVVGRDGTREQVIARYRADLWRRIRAGEIALADLAALESRRLACHCHPRPCHGEVLAPAAAWAARQLRAGAACAAPVLFWSRCPDWGWLSNFAAADFRDADGRAWATVEHWYQAGKTRDLAVAERICLAATPQAALRLGRAAPCRTDWNDRKLARMAEGLLLRFAPRRPGARTATPTGASVVTAPAPTGSAGCWRPSAPRVATARRSAPPRSRNTSGDCPTTAHRFAGREEEGSSPAGRQHEERREAMNTDVNPSAIPMAPHYVIRTIDEDWIDLFDPPSRIDDKRTAWEEAKRRVGVHPDCKTVIIDRYTGVTLWQSDPDIPPRYEVVAASRTYVYAVDDRNFPVGVLSSHKEKDDAWTAFSEVVKEPSDDIFLLRDTTPAQTVIASSDEDIYNTAVA